MRFSVGKVSGRWPMYLIVPEFFGFNHVYYSVKYILEDTMGGLDWIDLAEVTDKG